VRRLWIVGLFFMLCLGVLLATLRRIVRPGVLWFVRDPDDRAFSLGRELLEARRAPVATRLHAFG
jgi:E3 ubiquitin-protein ligase MARCH6